MNNKKAFFNSKDNDSKVIAYLNSIGKHVRSSSVQNDIKDKFDIIINKDKQIEYRIDTKYTSRQPDCLFFEYEKHGKNGTSKATHIWYFLNDDWKKTYLIKCSSLVKLTSDIREAYKPNKDLLKNFSINELVYKKDYYVIDMSKAKNLTLN